MGWVLRDIKALTLPRYFVNDSIGLVIVVENVFGADEQMRAEICRGNAMSGIHLQIHEPTLTNPNRLGNEGRAERGRR